MARIAAGIEYDGSAYHGWQQQATSLPTVTSVQQFCQSALSHIANHPVTVICAGRTDKGVHATGQVIHFNTTAERNPSAWIRGSNRHLPDDIRLLWALPVDDDFHARYCAISRSYRYTICQYKTRPALLRQQVSWYPYDLDVTKMAQAAQLLVGEHDFSAFRGANCQAKTPLRCIERIIVQQQANHFITIDIKANAFLYHMVRNIAGVLLAIGRHHQPVDWAAQVLQSKDRRQAGVTAKPEGLCLVHVEYRPPWQGLPNTTERLPSYNSTTWPPQAT